MRILHVADLHLDTPFIGVSSQLEVYQEQLIKAPYQAFERCIAIAINQAVDVVIIAGDIFDSQQQTIYAQNFFVQQLKRLEKESIPVIICYGNHDYIRSDRTPLKYSDNVHVFEDDSVSAIDLHLKNDETARFYGFSYTTNWISERKIKQFPINPQQTDYTIGVMHAQMESSTALNANYAPYSLPELLSKNYDYWALGHIHKAQILNEEPLVQYSGCIQGRHRNESGDKGAYIVELGKNQSTKNKFYSLSPIIWQNRILIAQNDWQASDIIEELNQIFANYLQESKITKQSYIINITIEQSQRLDGDLVERILDGELISALNQNKMEEPFVVISQIRLESDVTMESFEYDPKLLESFSDAKDWLYSDEGYHKVMDSLFNHSMVKTYLFELSEDEKFRTDVLESGEKLMIQSVGFVDIEEDNHEN